MPGEILKQQLAFSTWHSAIRRLSVAERSKGQVLNAWRQVQISCRVFICEHNCASTNILILIGAAFVRGFRFLVSFL